MEDGVTARKGSYLLVLQLDQAIPHLQVGKLGQYRFAAGTYLYVGSAFGPGGLARRLAHHQRRVKRRPHWHIDYLRPHARLREAWTLAGPERRECSWCSRLAITEGVTVPVPGFGSSDTGCRAHLFYMPRPPCVALLTHVLLHDLLLDSHCHAGCTVEVHIF